MNVRLRNKIGYFLVLIHLSFLPVHAVAENSTLANCKYWMVKLTEVARNFPKYVRPANLKSWKLDFALKKTVEENRPLLVRLGDLHPIHVIDVPEAQEKTKRRAQTLKDHRQSIINNKMVLDMKLQEELIASNIPMMVIQDRHGNYIIREGNGRYFALKEAFPDMEDMMVEVVLQDHKFSEKPMAILDEVLRLRGLTVGDTGRTPTAVQVKQPVSVKPESIIEPEAVKRVSNP